MKFKSINPWRIDEIHNLCSLDKRNTNAFPRNIAAYCSRIYIMCSCACASMGWVHQKWISGEAINLLYWLALTNTHLIENEKSNNYNIYSAVILQMHFGKQSDQTPAAASATALASAQYFACRAPIEIKTHKYMSVRVCNVIMLRIRCDFCCGYLPKTYPIDCAINDTYAPFVKHMRIK